MDVTVTFADSDVILALKVNKDMTVSDFRNHALREAGFPESDDALIFHQDEQLSGHSTLDQSGVQENDIIMIVRPSPEDRAANGGAAGSSGNGMFPGAAMPAGGGSVAASVNRDEAIERARQQILYNPDLFQNISERLPDLAAALHNPAEFRQVYNRHYEQQSRIFNNPNSEEAQKARANQTKQQAIDENLAMALEEMPEAFASVSMLYSQMEVNNEPVKAFIDSGAQTTIMSTDCAERCHISHLIDTRHQGIAMGVGQSKILGRIHMVPIKIGSSFLPCSFTIIEGIPMDMLLGLDMLKHHQATIDLRRNVLVMGDQEVEFLGEADIPRSSLSDPNMAQARAAGTKPPPGSSAIPTSAGQRLGTREAGSNSRGAPPPALSLPPRPVTTNSNSPGQAEFSEQAINSLTALGFDRAQAIQALRQTNGNADIAASLLFGG